LLFILEFLSFCATIGGSYLVFWFPFHWLRRFDDYDKSHSSNGPNGFKGWINKMREEGNPLPKFSAYFILILYIILAAILVTSPMQLYELDN
tara:strand:+ start:153 stop:428 length:276 start_codon:yes stop_codon:yes gene_type:complete